jgi:prefoldin subunit 5
MSQQIDNLDEEIAKRMAIIEKLDKEIEQKRAIVRQAAQQTNMQQGEYVMTPMGGFRLG